MAIIHEIRSKIALDLFELSRHAVDQSILREITMNEIRQVIKSGKIIERAETYTLLKDGNLFVIENVPARVDEETGEQYFSPQTVERLQDIILEHRKPAHFIQASVNEFA
jgi:YgiT-type zinc finger domain-containing protein